MAAANPPTTVASTVVPPVPATETIAEKFHRLAATWKKAVGLLSASRGAKPIRRTWTSLPSVRRSCR